MIQNRLMHLRAVARSARTIRPARFSTLTRLSQSTGMPSATQTPETAPKSRTLTPSSFALPKEPSKEQVQKMTKEAQPFNMTQLVRGHTDLKIGITDTARDKLQDIAKHDDGSVNENFALRVKVESGGCHGFQYNFELTTLDKELSEDGDLAVFQRTDMDLARIIFDESSLEILQDSKLDYTTELIGSSFKMVDSPYTSTSCGCGASFDFDFEKLEKAKARAHTH